MAIFPYQDDLRTDANPPGARLFLVEPVVFSPQSRALRLTGSLNIEWRTVHFADTTTTANFEVVLYESITSFDVIYGATSDNGLDETSGVQASSAVRATQHFSCGTATRRPAGLKVTYNCAGGGRRPRRHRQRATATGTPGGCTVNGSLDASDPTQSDRLFRSGIPQTCPASTTCAIFGDPTAAALRCLHVHQQHWRDSMRDGEYRPPIAQARTSSSLPLIWAALIQITSALTGSEIQVAARMFGCQSRSSSTSTTGRPL